MEIYIFMVKQYGMELYISMVKQYGMETYIFMVKWLLIVFTLEVLKMEFSYMKDYIQKQSPEYVL